MRTEWPPPAPRTRVPSVRFPPPHGRRHTIRAEEAYCAKVACSRPCHVPARASHGARAGPKPCLHRGHLPVQRSLRRVEHGQPVFWAHPTPGERHRWCRRHHPIGTYPIDMEVAATNDGQCAIGEERAVIERLHRIDRERDGDCTTFRAGGIRHGSRSLEQAECVGLARCKIEPDDGRRVRLFGKLERHRVCRGCVACGNRTRHSPIGETPGGVEGRGAKRTANEIRNIFGTGSGHHASHASRRVDDEHRLRCRLHEECRITPEGNDAANLRAERSTWGSWPNREQSSGW